jgi:hypothetical protein
MARHSPLRFEESFTFRLEPEMKAALTQAAAAEDRQPGELLRDLLRRYIADKERKAFEAEARRQCLAINALAQNPASDEAAVMAELDALLEVDGFRDEWKA